MLFFQSEYFFNIVNLVTAIICEPNDLRQKCSWRYFTCWRASCTTLKTTTVALQSFISRCPIKMNEFFWLWNSKYSFRYQHYSRIIYYVPRATAITFKQIGSRDNIIIHHMIFYEDKVKYTVGIYKLKI